MTHLMLTSALLFALLAVVAIAIGASLGIARDLVLDEPSDIATETEPAPAGHAALRAHGILLQGHPAREAYANRDVRAGRDGDAGRQVQGNGFTEDFGLGLQHATHFAQSPGRSFSRSRSFSPRV